MFLTFFNLFVISNLQNVKYVKCFGNLFGNNLRILLQCFYIT